MRTTIDIDGPILKDLKRLQQRTGQSLGTIVSELLSSALAEKRHSQGKAVKFEWVSKSLQPLVDIADKAAVSTILEREDELRYRR